MGRVRVIDYTIDIGGTPQPLEYTGEVFLLGTLVVSPQEADKIASWIKEVSEKIAIEQVRKAYKEGRTIDKG